MKKEPEKMKRICMVVPSFSAKGGIATVVSGYKGSHLEQEYEVRYIETYVDGGKFSKLGKALSAYGVFLWILFSWHPDLVHVHTAFGPSFFRKAPFIWIAHGGRIPVVVHIHGSELDKFYYRADKLKRWFVQSTLNICQRIIVLSQEWKKRFSSIVDCEKLTVVENYGVPAQIPVHSTGPKRILFLGFLSKAKGCLDIPDVAKQVNFQYPQTYWVLAGSAAPEELKALEKKICENGLQNQFELPGWVRNKEKEQLMKTASVFFLPSYSEAMPMSVLEAMSWGLPVVSTEVGGIPQLVEKGKNGYLLAPGDINGFAEAIKKLLADDTLRISMGNESLKRIKEKYSFDSHIKKIMAIYCQIFETEKM